MRDLKQWRPDAEWSPASPWIPDWIPGNASQSVSLDVVSGVNRTKIVKITFDALRTRQSLVKGERLVRDEMRAVVKNSNAGSDGGRQEWCSMREERATLRKNNCANGARVQHDSGGWHDFITFNCCWEQRENAGSLCQKFCCGLLHRSTHRSHRRQSAVTCSADREPPSWSWPNASQVS